MEESADRYVDAVRKRTDVLATLTDGPRELRAIEDRTSASRSTVNRAVRDLEDLDLVRRVDGRYGLTTLGRLALDHYRSYRRAWEDLLAAKGVLEAVPRDAPVDLDAVLDGEPLVPPAEAPYRPVRRLGAAVEAADRYRAVLPVLGDPKHLRLLYEHVVVDGAPAELIVSPRLRDSLAEEFPRRLPAMAGEHGFDLLVGDVPSVGVVLTDERDANGDGDDGGTTTTVTLLAFGETGGLAGVLHNDSERAVRWAESLYERVRADATPATDSLRRPPDGGVAIGSAGVESPAPPGLPVSLERQGFVRLTRSFFADRRAAAPTTAWRAGLGLTEVHTGYAVARTVGDGSGSEDGDEDGESLTDRLLGALAEGRDCAIVGPPGSGKSTTAKRVACAWYEADRGPVLYRERGRGAAFEAVDELVAAAEAAAGHALIVVEDAVRPEADAVFEVLDRLADRDDASVLVDARETEWRDPPGDRADTDDPALAVEPMPRLLDRDYERLVEHFEATAGVDVDLPVEDLRAEIERAGAAGAAEDGPAPGEVLLLLHRLSLYADPLADGATTLEEDVTRAYEDLADRGDAALDAAVLANALVAAGIEFGPAHLQAVADGDGNANATGAVRDAIEGLDGRVLFGRDGDGSYRTVHETWAVTFLERLLETAGEQAARERFGRPVSALLARLDGADGPAGPDGRIGDGSPARVEAAVESLYAVARTRPKLAPLFGTGGEFSVDLPDACGPEVRHDCTALLGRAFLGAGSYERAEAAFERLPATGEPGVERRLGLAEAARCRSDYDAARRHVDAGFDVATDVGPSAVGRVLVESGTVAVRRDEYDRAREEFTRALETFEGLDATRWTARCLRELGRVAVHRDEYDRARERAERSLELARELGDRHLELDSLNTLGTVAGRTSAFDRARERLQRVVDLARELGYRREEAINLMNLGLVARNCRAPDRARRYFERALEVNRAIDNRRGEAQTLNNLGLVARDQGDHEEARRRFREALDLCREIDYRQGEAVCLENLGEVAHRRGDLDRAGELARRGLAVAAEIGYPRGEAQLREVLAKVDAERDDHADARERFRRALATHRDIDNREGVARTLDGLARAARAEGDADPARAHARRAAELHADLDDPVDEAGSLRTLAALARDRGDEAVARDRLDAARDRLAAAGAPEAELDTLERLVEVESDPERVRSHCERALSLIEAAGGPLDERRAFFERERERAAAG